MSNFTPRQRMLYRSRRGIIFGVCQGLAEYLNVSVFWTRVVAVACLLLSGFWLIVGLYLLAALVMKPEPVLPPHDEEDSEFYHSYATSRTMALLRLKRAHEHLDRRIQRMESIVTSREYDWDRRFES